MKTFIIILFSLFGIAQAQIPMLAQSKKKAPASSSQFIRVNVYDSAANIGKYNTSGWNDWSISMANGTTCIANSAYYLWDNGSQSGVRTRIENTSAACPTGAQYVDNQSGESTYGDAETLTNFVKAHLRSAVISTAGAYRMVITGLPDNAASGYKIILLCSRNTTQNRRVTFAVGGTSQQVNAWDNIATEVVLDNLTPSSNTITVDITTQDGFGFVNAFIIEKK